MSMRAVPKAGWQEFFDRMSGALIGKRAEIEVASLELGDQIVAEWIPMIGITYDSEDDLLEIALEGTDHLIRHPREIAVEEASAGIASIGVVTAEGAREVVRLKDPMMLPASASH